MLFLGTGASELMPNPFCKCELCERIRQSGETPRKRSAFLFDETICIDFGPDVLAASVQYDAPFYDLKNIFITHTHEDHLLIHNLEVMLAPYHTEHQQIRLWISPKGAAWIDQYRSCCAPLFRGKCGIDQVIENGWLTICPVTQYQWINCGDFRFFAFETNHQGWAVDEMTLNYVIEKNGKRLLYACDTGLYTEKILDAIAGFGCDTVVMEGTYGMMQMPRGIGHLDCDQFIENAQTLVQCGAVKPDAKFYMTHINPFQQADHNQLQEYLSGHSDLDIIVARDGLRIE